MSGLAAVRCLDCGQVIEHCRDGEVLSRFAATQHRCAHKKVTAPAAPPQTQAQTKTKTRTRETPMSTPPTRPGQGPRGPLDGARTALTAACGTDPHPRLQKALEQALAAVDAVEDCLADGKRLAEIAELEARLAELRGQAGGKVPCPDCGAMMLPTGLGIHRARKHGGGEAA